MGHAGIAFRHEEKCDARGCNPSTSLATQLFVGISPETLCAGSSPAPDLGRGTSQKCLTSLPYCSRSSASFRDGAAGGCLARLPQRAELPQRFRCRRIAASAASIDYIQASSDTQCRRWQSIMAIGGRNLNISALLGRLTSSSSCRQIFLHPVHEHCSSACSLVSNIRSASCSAQLRAHPNCSSRSSSV